MSDTIQLVCDNVYPDYFESIMSFTRPGSLVDVSYYKDTGVTHFASDELFYYPANSSFAHECYFDYFIKHPNAVELFNRFESGAIERFDVIDRLPYGPMPAEWYEDGDSHPHVTVLITLRDKPRRPKILRDIVEAFKPIYKAEWEESALRRMSFT